MLRRIEVPLEAPSDRLVIGVDIDDVLFPTAQAIIDFYRSTYEVDVPVDQFYSKDPAIWGVADYKEAIRRVQVFLHSDSYAHQAPIEGAVDGVTEMREAGAYLIPITGRDEVQAESTRESLGTFFPGLFNEPAVFTNYFSDKKRRTKDEVCHELGVDYQIDDYPAHLRGLAQYAIKGVLFGGYPWARGHVATDMILHSDGWDSTPGVILGDYLKNQDGTI